MDIMNTFYDKKVDIYSVNIVRKRWADVKDKVILYEQVKCEYYIATRWNVVNRQPNLWTRQLDLDRIDLVIPWSEYDITKPLKQWMYVDIGSWTQYIIDQLEPYLMPDGSIENIYIRLNQKWS